MKTRAILLVVGMLVGGAVACEDRTSREGTGPEARREAESPMPGMPGTDGGSAPSATAGGEDQQIADHIRQAISADQSFSPSARSVEVTADEGVVTLRGEVRSEQEKERLASIAQQVAGVQRVENELEVAS
jgi:hyperosmotically inducible periplasmic protein